MQARGQLRLTWRLYAESPQSGEISFLNSPGSMEEGDLSTQSIMGAFSICLPYRHAAPLEMTVLAGSIQSFQKGTNDKNAASHSRHFSRSVAEWRNLTSPMTEKPARTLRHFDRSGAEWRNLLPPMVHEAWRQEISEARVSIEPCIPVRYPFQMTRGSP